MISATESSQLLRRRGVSDQLRLTSGQTDQPALFGNDLILHADVAGLARDPGHSDRTESTGCKTAVPLSPGRGRVVVLLSTSGVHATLAGVTVALCIPMGRPEEARSPLLLLKEKLHMWVAFAVVPIFGFANAGASLTGISMENLVDPVPLGVALELLVGKQVGIFLLAALAIRLGLAKLAEGSTWTQLYVAALLGGIGFTMNLFIGNQAFAGSAHLIDEVKVGVLIGSILAAIGGVIVLRRSSTLVGAVVVR